MRQQLCRQYPKLGRAMMLRETLQDVLADEDPTALRWWVTRARRSRLEPFRQLVDQTDATVRRTDGALSNFVVDVFDAHHGLREVIGEVGFVETLQDSLLACAAAIRHTVVHSKSLRECGCLFG